MFREGARLVGKLGILVSRDSGKLSGAACMIQLLFHIALSSNWTITALYKAVI
jgi:hypothetical protein